MDMITINGREVRVECNFNAICAFMDSKGIKSLDFLSQELSMSDWLGLMVASINEGERQEGRPSDFSVLKVGELPMGEITRVMTEFIAIFAKQNGAAESKKK